jgi:hypothetical protein
LRDLGSRKDRNILKLEINEIMADNVVERNGQFFVLKVLNFPSPRPFFFTILIKGKGFTDPFFRLLDFLGRNVGMP